MPMLRARRYTQSASILIVPIAPRGHASRDAPRHKWHRLRIQLAERMTWITLKPGHTSAPHSRADAERPGRHSHAEREERSLRDIDRANAPRWHASRDALRHKWHRPRIQLAERMTWITLEPGHTSAPHSKEDAERPGRHSHAERGNDQLLGGITQPERGVGRVVSRNRQRFPRWLAGSRVCGCFPRGG